MYLNSEPLSITEFYRLYKLTRCRAEIRRLREIKDQVDDVLAVNWISVKNGDYRKALADLVSLNIEESQDPVISKEAAELKELLYRVRDELDRRNYIAGPYLDLDNYIKYRYERDDSQPISGRQVTDNNGENE